MPSVRRTYALDLPRPPLEVIAALRRAGHLAYAVGGAVRDALRGEPIRDVDIATSATPREVGEIFPRTHEVGAQFGVMIVVQDDLAVEVATFRTEGGYVDGRHPGQIEFSDLEGDAARRDFTVNALYYDPIDEEVLDSVGGLADLDLGVLRCIGEAPQRFAEDHLRLLRCARLASQLDFWIEESTWYALQEQAVLITRVSTERIRQELERVLTGPAPSLGLRILLYSGLLEQVLPEVRAMVGVQQPPEFHPEGDVFVHTCLVLDHLTLRHPALGWGALLHDVGKPPTFSIADRIRFDRHVPVGAEMSEKILERLRCDRDTAQRAVELVQQHLRFRDVERMRPATLKRFLRQDHFEDHMRMHRADCMASHGDLSLYEFCRTKLAEMGNDELRPDPLLSGHDLLDLGYAPGPLIGRILRGVEDQQLEGQLADRTSALDYVRDKWPLSPGTVG